MSYPNTTLGRIERELREESRRRFDEAAKLREAAEAIRPQPPKKRRGRPPKVAA